MHFTPGQVTWGLYSHYLHSIDEENELRELKPFAKFKRLANGVSGMWIRVRFTSSVWTWTTVLSSPPFRCEAELRAGGPELHPCSEEEKHGNQHPPLSLLPPSSDTLFIKFKTSLVFKPNWSVNFLLSLPKEAFTLVQSPPFVICLSSSPQHLLKSHTLWSLVQINILSPHAFVLLMAPESPAPFTTMAKSAMEAWVGQKPCREGSVSQPDAARGPDKITNGIAFLTMCWKASSPKYFAHGLLNMESSRV